MPEKSVLIQQLPVERDKMGFWTHPQWPFDGEENAIPKSWFPDNSLEVCTVEMENDGPEGLFETWADGGACDCTPWSPSSPCGDGWFTFSIHDTEDGPICVWVRRAAQEKWSLNGENGSWSYNSLAELIKDNYGHDSDGDGHPASFRPGLYEGDTIYRAIEHKDDPAGFLPDADQITEIMFDNAASSDAGEWVDAYPSLDKQALLDLEVSLEPLKVWARKYCQPDFFTVEAITSHIITKEEVREALA